MVGRGPQVGVTVSPVPPGPQGHRLSILFCLRVSGLGVLHFVCPSYSRVHGCQYSRYQLVSGSYSVPEYTFEVIYLELFHAKSLSAT